MSKFFALLDNEDVVIGVQQVPDSFELADNQIPITFLDVALLGMKYENDEFVEVVKEVENLPKHITKLAFKQRMTSTERKAIRNAAKTNDTVFDFNDLVDSSTYIDLERQDTIDGLNYLEFSLSILEDGRASEILTDPILDSERPQ